MSHVVYLPNFGADFVRERDTDMSADVTGYTCGEKLLKEYDLL